VATGLLVISNRRPPAPDVVLGAVAERFCNRSLWPLMHGFPGRVRYADDEWAAYVEANLAFGERAAELVDPDGIVWVHDYHLLLAASALRRRGHRGPIGLFVHVPFPAPDVFETLPWAHQVLQSLTAFDVIGFHTAHWAMNFLASARTIGALVVRQDVLHHRRGTTRVGVFPLGVDHERFRYDRLVAASADVDMLRAGLEDRKLLLGVDRLDYSKGIPERLEGFERLLELHPRWRGRVTFVQISVPSSEDVPEYAELRARVEQIAGRINGRFGEPDWMPVRYLYRSYEHDVLAQIYRAADVAVVTPLRDGMNLVAKEFVAAQDPARPGVLVLSRFAGAADELKAAVLTNPYHRDGLAEDLDRALSMPDDERRARHGLLRASVLASTPADWANEFLDTLEAQRPRYVQSSSTMRS
jgi:alpha,alpha-trehalose-phosphate synthase [UDP-forming]